ncbi:MAG TPA: diacylglycerol kinase [Candidatus Acidoferrum sp.]|jgi:diacylglycerol kinase (ATP)|nr:diacylglycerol kinase [Candidatus Acidoferrum sp.]
MRFWRSFNHAFAGIMYAARTQPNMRAHLIISLLVILAALILRLGRDYVVDLVIIIAVVLALELLNTAVESIVDLLTVTHHPLAKTAKDAAAGAVLIASIAAVVVGYLIFYQGLINGGQRVYEAVASVPSNIAFVVLAVVAIATIFAKAWVGRGSALQGGAISGHAALAFAAATLLAFLYQRPLAALLAYFVAFLVAQSRVEAKIHSTGEVVAGSVLGAVVALAVYLLARSHLVL